MISKVEIGSVIELEDWRNYLYRQENKKFRLPFMCEKVDEYKSVFYQSGRNAIEELMKYMQKHMDIKKILIPDFVCKTVTDAVERSGMMYEKYCVDCNFEVQLEEIQRKIESGIKSIYIVQYFGKRNTPEFLSSIAEWKKQKEIYTNENQKYSLALGFATFYLNRTNRSGILAAGPIGGYNQTGNYLIDARYNKESLVERIEKIAKHKTHIHLYNKDIESFIIVYHNPNIERTLRIGRNGRLTHWHLFYLCREIC